MRKRLARVARLGALTTVGLVLVSCGYVGLTLFRASSGQPLWEGELEVPQRDRELLRVHRGAPPGAVGFGGV